MKYVMFKDQTGALWPVLFPEQVTHSDITVTGMQPVSAGFVDSRDGTCFGKSDSLKLAANPDDSVWVRFTLANHNSGLLLLNCDKIAEANWPDQIPLKGPQ